MRTLLRPRRALLATFALLWLPTAPAAAETFEVGPGMTHAAIGDVPWESLMPGDVVRIHWRAAPYAEKWVIGRRGTESAPIVVQGVPGPGGELPVIDGRDATTRSALSYTNENRGVIKIGSSNTPPDVLPAWIVIDGLDVRSGRAPHRFSGRAGLGTYSDNAAAIYIEKGEHIVIRNCVMRDSGNGLFIGAFDGQTRDILVEGNLVYDNGIDGSIYQHNSYTAAIGIVFQHNHYGPLRAGCLGNNLKDRSAGLVVRFNWIESGNRQLDLVDAEDSAVLVAHPSYGRTFVYGNVLVEHEGDGNSQIVHYGGDSGTEADYRKGLLHFFNNTIVSTRSGNTTLLRLSTNEEEADVRNNVIHVTAGGSRLAMLGQTGVLRLSHNWTRPGFVTSHDTFTGTVMDDGTGISGTAPGFVDAMSQDFHLAGGSACIDMAGALHAEALPDHDLVSQYVRHQRAEPRPLDGALDIGAFEHCEPGPCVTERPDGGPMPGTDGGSMPGADGGSTPGTDGGTLPRADGATGGGDAGGPGSGGDVEGGCGCRVRRSGTSSGPWAAVAGLTAFIIVARRRRRTAAPPLADDAAP